MKVSCILLLALAAQAAASVLNTLTDLNLEQLRQETDVLHEKLKAENCWNQQKNMRGVIQKSSDGNDLGAQTELYNRLMDLPIACRKGKQETTTNISVLLPVECVNAVDLTQSWRKDHNGTNISYKANTHHCNPREMVAAGRPWFRIAGQAGNRLLDRCVPVKSCGTYVPLWSNATMPLTIGMAKSIDVYGHWKSICTFFKCEVSVMRCSDAAHDFIYRYDDSLDSCDFAFCGMDA